MAKVGRPSTYDEEIAQQICERVFAGELVKDACADLGVTTSSLWRWGESYPEFREAFARARVGQGHSFFEMAVDRSRKPLIGEIVKTDHEGNEEVTTKDAVDRSKLEVDTLRWAAGKLAPREYGDKLALEHSGSINFNDMSDEDIVDRMRELIASGRVSLPDGYELVEIEDEEDHSDLA